MSRETRAAHVALPRRGGLRRLAILVVTALAAGTLALTGVAVAQAAPGDYTVEITAPASTPVRQAFSYTVTLDTEADAVTPATGIVLTAVLDEGVVFDSVPTGSDSPVASYTYNAATRTVSFTMKSLTEELTSFVFSVQQNNNTVKDESTVFDASISGSVTPSGATPTDAVTTTVTGDFGYAPSKNYSTVVGSGNRSVTYTLNLGTLDVSSTTDTFTTWGQRYIDALPAGAVVTSTSTGFGTWTISGTQATGQTASWENTGFAYGPSGSGLDGISGHTVSFTVNYPEESFPTGTRPPINTVSYEVQDYSGAWHNNGRTASIQGPEFAEGVAKRVAIAKYSNVNTEKETIYTDGYFLRQYKVQASYINTLDPELLNEMVVSDSASDSAANAQFFNHTDIYTLTATFSAPLQAAAVPITLQYQVNGSSTWQTFATQLSSNTDGRVAVQRAGSIGYQDASPVVTLGDGEHLTGWRYIISPGAGDPLIPSGSEITVVTGFVPLYESVTDQSTSELYLPNVASVAGTLESGAAIDPAEDSAAIRFVDAVYITTTVDAPSSLEVGSTANYVAGIVNQNETDTYSDSKLKVVLPVGVYYDSAVGATRSNTTVTGTDIPVPQVGAGVTVTTETITGTDGLEHQVVVFTFDTLPPMRPFGESSSRWVESEGFRYNIPVTIVAQAYDPVEQTVPVVSWAYTDDPAYTGVPMTGYGPFFSTDDNNFDANRAIIARASANSEVVTAGGLLLGKLVRADGGDSFGLSAVVESPGVAEWQVYVSNILPATVTDLVLFDRLPVVGDGRDSEFAVTLASAVTGAPAGSTVEYSTDATSATTGTWTSTPAGATAFRISVPSIAASTNFTLLVPTTVPGGVDFAEAAINDVTGTGVYSGSPRTFASNDATITAAPNPAFELVKTTNGVEYGSAPGALVSEGSEVEWAYTVTNTGGTPLDDLAISDAYTDGAGGTGTLTPTSTESGPLLPGESRTFTATGTAVLGQYQNTATASATPVDDNGDPLAVTLDDITDDSWYLAGASGLQIVKTTNGEDVTSAPGAYLEPGSAVTWEYAVTNTGTLPLVDVLVQDKDADGNVVFEDTIPLLAVGETVTLDASGTAIEGQYHNTVTASADNPAGGAELVVADDSWYFGATSGLDIEKKVSDSATGPWVELEELESGDAAYWQLTVTNTGNSPLTDVEVSDPELGTIPAIGDLPAGESKVIILTQDDVVEGYTNVATVTGTDPLGAELTADDDAAVTVVDEGEPTPTSTNDPSSTATPDPSPSGGNNPNDDENLAHTGSSLTGAAILMAVLLALGAALLIARRVRRNRA